jgi:hydrogenase maturation protease
MDQLGDLGRPPVLVLAVGNLLLGDDAAGLRLLEAVRRQPDWGPEVEFLDGGTAGLMLLGELDGRRALVVLDAVDYRLRPGAVEVLEPGAAEGFHRSSTAHEGNAGELLATARLLGVLPERVTLVGIQAASLATGIGLSPAVEAALPEAARLARDRILGYANSSCARTMRS